MAKMTDAEILSRAQARVQACVGFMNGTLNNQRELALRYYRGDRFGNEVEGRSQVVSRDVSAYIDTVMPSLMRIFAGGDQIVNFEPTEPSDEDAARQATDYVNWIWSQQNDGFVNFHHMFKDGLINKLGVLKIWWDDTPKQTSERYFGLSAEELDALRKDADIEVGEVTEKVEMTTGPDGMPLMVTLFDAVVVKSNREGRVVVEPVPPEEFLFGRRAKSDQNADVLAHRTTKSQSDLIASGYDPEQVKRLFASDTSMMTSERIARFEDVDDSPMRMTTLPSDGVADVEVTEAYLRMDVDGDGIAEYLKVCYAGNELLDVETVDDHPFACVTPNLIPHRLVGQSMADQLMDIQMIKSTVLRQVLDNSYLQNMPQLMVDPSKANMDDVLTRRPGGIIRVKEQGAVAPLQTQPLGREPYTLIEYMDTVAEQRTGATRYNQGLDANTLNKTATGINLIQNAAAQRVELIARVYAETGVKRAFKLILGLVCKHQNKPKTIRLRNQWVTMDPRGWKTSMDMTIAVGLGTGNKDQIMAHMMSLLQVDEKLVALQGGLKGPLLYAENIYAKLRRLIEAAGLKGVEIYYTDPEAPNERPPEPPQPDPRMLEMQAKAQMAQAEMQMRMQAKQAETQADIEAQRVRAEAEIEIARMRAQADIALMREKMAAEMELKAWQAQHGAQMAEQQMAMKAVTADA